MSLPYVTVDNLSIHYRCEGEGSPIVLLHGMGSNSKSWKNQINAFKDYFKVFAWDAPGYGKSSDPKKELIDFKSFAEILKKFLDQLQLKNIYILGHSMGSALAMELYNLYPEYVDSLILADPTRGSAPLNNKQNEKSLQNRLNNISSLSPEELAKQRVTKVLSRFASDKTKEIAKSIMSEIRPAGYRSVAYSLYNVNQTDLYPLIHIPTLILCGELDEVTPVSESEAIQQNVPQSELAIIPKAGHLSYLEAPNFFNHNILKFLKQTG